MRVSRGFGVWGLGFVAKYYSTVKREFLNEYSDTNYAFLVVFYGFGFKLVSVLIDIIELQ